MWSVWSLRGLYTLLGIFLLLLAVRWESPADPIKTGSDFSQPKHQRQAQASPRTDGAKPPSELPTSLGSKIEEDFMLQAGDRIFFPPQSLELSLREREILSAQARWLKAHDKFAAILQGYADDPPLTDQEQEHLAKRRAEEVHKFLVREGISSDRLRIISMGRKHPIALCEEAACAAQNRRVVTVLTVRTNPPSVSSPATTKKDAP